MSENEKKSAKARIVDAMLHRAEVEALKPYLTLLGLSSEMAHRFLSILAVHTVLDRVLTLAIATGLSKTKHSGHGPDFPALLEQTGKINFERRAGMAKALGTISSTTAANIMKVNKARNALVHFSVKDKDEPTRHLFAIGEVKEMKLKREFDECMRCGNDALGDLMRAMFVQQQVKS